MNLIAAAVAVVFAYFHGYEWDDRQGMWASLIIAAILIAPTFVKRGE